MALGSLATFLCLQPCIKPLQRLGIVSLLAAVPGPVSPPHLWSIDPWGRIADLHSCVPGAGTARCCRQGVSLPSCSSHAVQLSILCHLSLTLGRSLRLWAHGSDL